MHKTIDTLYYGNYKFIVELDTGAETGHNQRLVWVAQKRADNKTYEEEHYLRDFYFEETNANHIRHFCREFAINEDYRREVSERRARWYKRNELFVRNLPPVCNGPKGELGERLSDEQMREFFHWIDANYEAIVALPEYQRLQELDSTFHPNTHEIDPSIYPAVQMLNRLTGVATRYSCQGISGKIHFQNRDLMTVSPHEEYAYVSFDTLEEPVYTLIVERLSAFPAITLTHPPHNCNSRITLYSSGDNLRFRAELLALAEAALAFCIQQK